MLKYSATFSPTSRPPLPNCLPIVIINDIIHSPLCFNFMLMIYITDTFLYSVPNSNLPLQHNYEFQKTEYT